MTALHQNVANCKYTLTVLALKWRIALLDKCLTTGIDDAVAKSSANRLVGSECTLGTGSNPEMFFTGPMGR